MTVPLPLEDWRERPTAAHDTHQVDVEDALPVLGRLDVDPAAGRDAGVVDQQVEAAPLAVHQVPGGFPVTLGAHVQGEVCRVARHALGAALREVTDDDEISLCEKGFRQRQAETGGAAGDQRPHRAPAPAAAAAAYGLSRCLATTPR